MVIICNYTKNVVTTIFWVFTIFYHVMWSWANYTMGFSPQNDDQMNQMGWGEGVQPGDLGWNPTAPMSSKRRQTGKGIFQNFWNFIVSSWFCILKSKSLAANDPRKTSKHMLSDLDPGLNWPSPPHGRPKWFGPTFTANYKPEVQPHHGFFTTCPHRSWLERINDYSSAML